MVNCALCCFLVAKSWLLCFKRGCYASSAKKKSEKDYVKRGNLSEISKILLVKLNMINIGSNYGKPMKCPKCEEDKDLTTEHLLTCQRRDSRIFTEMDLEETKKGRNTSDCK